MLARHSYSMLLVAFFFSTVILSAFTYSAEKEVGTFISMFDAMYWCLITQTTLGYGDITPATILGRMLAVVTAYIGIINLTFMINVLGACFDEAYTRFLTKEEKILKEQLILEMHSEGFKNNRVLPNNPESEKPDTFSRDISPAKAKQRVETYLVNSSPRSKTFFAKVLQHPMHTSLSSEICTNKPDGKNLRELTLKLTELAGQLIKNDSKIQSLGYGSLQQSMMELRDYLNKELSY